MSGGAPAVLRVNREEDGALLRLTLARPKGNVLDTPLIAALIAAVEEHRGDPALKSLLIDAEGPNFSFGASVAEHLPEAVGALLPSFHQLFRGLARSNKVLLAAVRGSCLGGGLELAAFCQRVFASPDAKLGNPEIKLGVFAPVASALLPLRAGQAAADDLLLSGRTVTAAEALELGLVDQLDADPGAAALAWHRQHLAGHSAAALGHAVRAARRHFHERFLAALAALERQYLDELMSCADAAEGVRAFLDKRPARWKNA